MPVPPPLPNPPRNEDAEAFVLAVAMGEAGVIRSAIKAGVNVNATGSRGTPPLVLAVAQGNEPIVDLLLAAGADVDKPDRDGLTALQAAVTVANERLVAKLLARRPSLNAVFGKPPLTPLAIAIRNNRLKIAHMLLEAGADPNAPIGDPHESERKGTTALIYAASAGDINLLRLLIAHHADLDKENAEGLTALMAAAFRGELGAVKELVEAGAKVNTVNRKDPARPFTALDLAAMKGYDHVEAYLRARAADKASR